MEKLVKPNTQNTQRQDYTPAKVVAQTVRLYAEEFGLVPGVHYVYLGGNPYITSDGLLWLGNNHKDIERRIIAIKAEIMQADFEKSIFVVKATVILGNGQEYQGIGTATKDNLTRITLHHGLEMAETRAVARALRKAYAIGIPSLEELSEKSEKEPEPQQPHPQQPQQQAISDKQRNRLFAIAKEHGVSNDEIKEIIGRYGYTSTKDIKIEDYDKIVKDIEEFSEKEPE